MHREEGEVHGDEHQPEMDQPELFIQHPAEDLREIVIDAGEDSHDRAAEQHVVEVGDDEVGVGLLQISGRRRVHDARDPADGEQRD